MGVGRGSKIMNKRKDYMLFNYITKKIVLILTIFFVVAGAFSGDLGNLQNGSTLFVPQTVSAFELTPPPLPDPIVRTCVVTASAYEVPTGADLVISWQTTGYTIYTLNGQTINGPSGSKTFHNIQESDSYTLVASDESGNTCTSKVTVYCIPVPPPTCTLTPTTKTINSGEAVTLAWTTTNANSATLTDFGTVSLNGSQGTGALTASKTYVLSVLGKNGNTISCQSVITVTPPVPTFCELRITKSVDKTSARPGDEVNYSIFIKNIGTGNCSGSGVKIVDVHDSQLTFISAGQSSNILPGYTDIPLYTASTRTIVWNGDVLTPGEEGTMTWKARINSLACDTSKLVKNTAKATALELGNYTQWVNSNIVETTVTANACPIPAPTCSMTPASITINSGEAVTLTWVTTNASTTSLTSFNTVPLNGSQNTGALTASKTYVLSVLGKNGNTISCQSVINVKDTPPAPSCDTFTANPSTILKGGTSTLAWTTSNITRVVIDNGIGEVRATGTLSVSPLSTIEYTLKAYGVSGAEATCKAKITVNEIPVIPLPECLSFVASPSTLPVGGGNVVLTWTTKNGISASILPTIGAVSLNGSTTVAVATSTNFTLTVLGQNNKSVSCVAPVIVTPPVPVPFTCANNVNFSANPTKISRGDNSVLIWTTNGVDSLSLNQGISATGLSSSVTVEPQTTTTYTLTAKKGSETISCPVTVEVTTGGGGGGSSSPTCELTVSKNKIKSGDTVTLRWDSNRATNLELIDSKNKVLVTTKNKLADDKDELFDGSIKVSPKSDTTYTLTVERGSRDRVCKVKVEVEDKLVVTQVREQKPLIAGIALTQVPYTGFAAGPIMTMSFYLLLISWALYLAYVLVIKRDVIGGYKLAPSHIVAEAPTPEEIRPELFVASVKTPIAPTLMHVQPNNLPVAQAVVGYAKSPEVAQLTVAPTVKSFSQQATDEVVTAIENHAHAKRALLSSDAIRQLIGSTSSFEDSIATLNEVILEAKSKYPSEDGWVVINEKRMHELCLSCKAKPVPSSVAPYIPTVIPDGSGSLAEAIVTGNIIAAYEMIGHRPMFALADAATDMDSVYRYRRGEKEVISELLLEATAKLTDDQLKKIIEALTGALDGTYTDEASAVKMAIMKAVKVVA